MSETHKVADLLDNYAGQNLAERARRYETLLDLISKQETHVVTLLNAGSADADSLRSLAWHYDVRTLMEKVERNLAAGRPSWARENESLQCETCTNYVDSVQDFRCDDCLGIS